MRKALLAFACLISLPLGARAQEIEFDQESQNAFKALTSAFVAFGTTDSLAAGTYKFKNKFEPDGEMDLYKIVGEFPLGDSDSDFVPLFIISPDYIDFDQEVHGDTPADVSIDSWGIGTGVGLKMGFFDKALTVTPRFRAHYSELDYDFDIEGLPDDLVDALVPDIDAWSYVPSVEAEYRVEVCDDEGAFIANASSTYLYVDGEASNELLRDFSSESWVSKYHVAWEQPVESDALGKLYLRPSFGRVDIRGAARDGLQFNHFYESTLDILSREVLKDYFKEVGFGVTYLYEDEVQGWRLGVSGKFV